MRSPDSNCGDQVGDGAGLVGIVVVPGLEDLAEDPLCPPVVLRIGCGHTATLVMAQPQTMQLTSHVGNGSIGADRRMFASSDCVLLSRQAKRVETHRVTHVAAQHALVPAVDIGADETQRVAYVQAATRWVGKHVEHKQLLAPAGEGFGIGEWARRVGRLERLILVPGGLPAQFDVLRQRGVVAPGWNLGG